MDEESREIVRGIAERLGAAQRRRGLSDAALAERSGVTPIELEKVMRAEVEPSPETLWRLAGALGVRPGDLLPPPAG